MFGIKFLNNKNLRRILTDYGFRGFPLRKEFPLTGFTEIRYNDTIQSIKLELVEFTQIIRFFSFENP